MSFWKSVEHKAQKKHCCELCHKAIQVGEKYSRQTGVVEGDFQDYCLCLRCLWLLKQHPGREVIGDIWELLSDYDYISCPNCGAYNYEIEEVDEDIENLTFSCGKCGNWWLENLSLEELKKGEQEDGDKEENMP